MLLRHNRFCLLRNTLPLSIHRIFLKLCTSIHNVCDVLCQTKKKVDDKKVTLYYNNNYITGTVISTHSWLTVVSEVRSRVFMFSKGTKACPLYDSCSLEHQISTGFPMDDLDG